MYEAHWGFQRVPFREGLNCQEFFPTPTHQEALARLEFLVEHRRRLGLLLGPGGSGKSLLLQVLAAGLRDAGTPVACLNLLGVDVEEFLWNVASQLGTTPTQQEPLFRLWRRVVDRIRENHVQQLPTVLLLDDAGDASDQVLTYLLRIAHVHPAPDVQLTLVLSSSEETVQRLGPRLLDLSELRIELEPWEPEETQRFVRQRMQEAGAEADLFAPGATERLHQLAHGVPRQVRQLAELALVAGAGRQLRQIDSETIDMVHAELKQ